jgi:hypothetical protein
VAEEAVQTAWCVLATVAAFAAVADLLARFRTVNSATQSTQIDMSAVELGLTEESDTFSDFLLRAQALYVPLGLTGLCADHGCRCDFALLQNEVADMYADDFAKLTDEDAAWGSKNEDTLTVRRPLVFTLTSNPPSRQEFNSFTHHSLSKGKRVCAIDWQPGAKGIIAAAMGERWPFEERVRHTGAWHPGAILIWNFIDTINPQFVLEAPNDVMCFRFNPANPNMVAAGCVNGQVCPPSVIRSLRASLM